MVGIIRLVVGERKGEIEYCLCVRMEDNVVFLTATDVEFVDRVSELNIVSVSETNRMGIDRHIHRL